MSRQMTSFYFETIDNKTFLYTRDEVYEIRKRLYELENVLNRKGFFPVLEGNYCQRD